MRSPGPATGRKLPSVAYMMYAQRGSLVNSDTGDRSFPCVDMARGPQAKKDAEACQVACQIQTWSTLRNPARHQGVDVVRQGDVGTLVGL